VWPLSSSIENVMAEQATASMTKWVDFACKAVEETLATPLPSPFLPPSSSTVQLQEEALSEEGAKRALSILPSPSLTRAGSVRRWPTAIVSRSSSSFPLAPTPLTGTEGQADQLSFQDASEAFSTPQSSMNRSRYALQAPSDLATPLLEEETEGRDIEEGKAFQEEGFTGAEIRARLPREQEDLRMMASELRSLSSEVKEMRKVIEALRQSSLQNGREADQGRSIFVSQIVMIVISLLFGLWVLRLVFYPYHTGLIFPPPSPPLDQASFH
jgi:hypothetical protein